VELLPPRKRLKKDAISAVADAVTLGPLYHQMSDTVDTLDLLFFC
jgi:hypothetical protein